MNFAETATTDKMLVDHIVHASRGPLIARLFFVQVSHNVG